MEWADVARLYRYWRERPPLHELPFAMGLVTSQEKLSDAPPPPSMNMSQINDFLRTATPRERVF